MSQLSFTVRLRASNHWLHHHGTSGPRAKRDVVPSATSSNGARARARSSIWPIGFVQPRGRRRLDTMAGDLMIMMIKISELTGCAFSFGTRHTYMSESKHKRNGDKRQQTQNQQQPASYCSIVPLLCALVACLLVAACLLPHWAADQQIQCQVCRAHLQAASSGLSGTSRLSCATPPRG